MKERISVWDSPYIIDGVKQEDTPGGILRECSVDSYSGTRKAKSGRDVSAAEFSPITDESVDFPPVPFRSGAASFEENLAAVKSLSEESGEACRHCPGVSARLSAAEAIIGTLWRQGSFRIGDIVLSAKWEWDAGKVGNLAAFYMSVKAAGEYLYDLGVRIDDFSFADTPGKCRTAFTVTGVHAAAGDRDDAFGEFPFSSGNPSIGDGTLCGQCAIPDKNTRIIYIPFDTCNFRLGGSLLAKACGNEGGTVPETGDPDYFIDCYEVVRELSEDGIIKAGATVGRGGLAAALDAFCGTECGISADISGIGAAYMEKDSARILFGEIPGIIIQIDENDFEYVDSQLLLQDVAYYPLGSPSSSFRGVRVTEYVRSALSGILESLIKSYASEGED